MQCLLLARIEMNSKMTLMCVLMFFVTQSIIVFNVLPFKDLFWIKSGIQLLKEDQSDQGSFSGNI